MSKGKIFSFASRWAQTFVPFNPPKLYIIGSFIIKVNSQNDVTFDDADKPNGCPCLNSYVLLQNLINSSTHFLQSSRDTITTSWNNNTLPFCSNPKENILFLLKFDCSHL